MGTHRTRAWFTPGGVVCRIGEDTYRIKVGPGQFRGRHASQPRAREPDVPGNPSRTTTMLSWMTTPPRRSGPSK